MIDLREKKLRRARRTRRNIARRASARPRLSVARSHKNISAQIIDDVSGCTLASASTLESLDAADVGGASKTDAAERIGMLIAHRGKEAGVSKVVFDRGGYVYHGRVRALAEAARRGGLDF